MTKFTPLRTVALVALALLAAALPLSSVLSSPAGAASTTPPVPEAVNGYDYNGIWAGNYRLDSGAYPTFCITAGAAYPTGTYTGAQAFPASTNADRIAWIIYKYGSSTDNDAEAAVAALVGKYFDTVNPNEKWDVLDSTQLALANSYWSQASSQAGPDTANVSSPVGIPENTPETAQVVVDSASGSPLSDFTVQVTGDGATVPATVTTEANGVANIPFSIPSSNTTGTYAIRVSGTEHDNLVSYVPVGSPQPRQTVIGSGSSTVFAGQAGGTFTTPTTTTTTTTRPPTTTTTRPGSPTTTTTHPTAPTTTTTAPAGPAAVGTVAKTHRADVGAGLSDVVSITLPSRQSAVLTGSLYGPVAPIKGSCQGLTWTNAPIAGSFTPINVNASETVTSSPIVTTRAGCYSFAEALALSTQTITTSPGVASETVTVVAVRKPHHVPQVNAGLAASAHPASVKLNAHASGCTSTPSANTIAIATLCIRAPVVSSGLAGGNVSVPADVHNVGWFTHSAKSNAKTGSTAIVGHINYVGQGPGAFANLPKLHRGATIGLNIRSQGTTHWKVVSVTLVKKGTLKDSLYSHSGKRYLVLISCAGQLRHYSDGWHYTDNVIVRAVPLH